MTDIRVWWDEAASISPEAWARLQRPTLRYAGTWSRGTWMAVRELEELHQQEVVAWRMFGIEVTQVMDETVIHCP